MVLELEVCLGLCLMQWIIWWFLLIEVGSFYLECCKQIVVVLEEVDDLLLVGSVKFVGLLCINVFVIFGILYLVLLWLIFLECYLEVELDIIFLDCIVDIIDEGYDLVICIVWLVDFMLIYCKFISISLFICVLFVYLEVYGMLCYLYELVQYQIISYSYNYGKDEWQFSGFEGLVSVCVNVCMYVNNGDSCVQVVLGGIGIMCQLIFMIDQYLCSGQLVLLFIDYIVLDFGIYVVYFSCVYLLVKVRVMLDFLFEVFVQVYWFGLVEV